MRGITAVVTTAGTGVVQPPLSPFFKGELKSPPCPRYAQAPLNEGNSAVVTTAGTSIQLLIANEELRIEDNPLLSPFVKGELLLQPPLSPFSKGE